MELAHDDNEFRTRIAFFHLLEVSARREILILRQEVLRKHLGQIEQSRLLVSVDAPNHFYVTRLLAFQEQQIQQELVWIAELMLVDSSEQ